MPTDATGTPTTIGLPKYDTSVDAPSGLGFNAAMDAIDSHLRSGFTLAAPSDADVPVWDATAGRWVSSTAKLPSIVTSLTSVPTGGIIPFGGASAPTGWTICDGTAISRTTFVTLFGVINTLYGAGNGTTTFNIPDLRGRMPAGFAPSSGHADVSTLGLSDGVAVANRRPKHATSITDPTHFHTTAVAGGGQTSGGPGGNVQTSGTTNTDSKSTGITAGVGGTAPIDTPAYLVLNYIIKNGL